MSIVEMLDTPVPFSGAVVFIAIFYLSRFFVSLMRMYSAYKCGYDCSSCKNWDCEVNYCMNRKRRFEKKKNSR